MLSVLLAVPKTPLYARLEAEGRLVAGDHDDWSHYVGTAGTANFHPLHMTREELKRRQMLLYQRLYEPAAFEARFLGNLSRFRDCALPAGTHARQQFRDARPHRAAVLERGLRSATILCEDSMARTAPIAAPDRADRDLPGDVPAFLQGSRADAGVGSVAEGAASDLRGA